MPYSVPMDTKTTFIDPSALRAAFAQQWARWPEALNHEEIQDVTTAEVASDILGTLQDDLQDTPQDLGPLLSALGPLHPQTAAKILKALQDEIDLRNDAKTFLDALLSVLPVFGIKIPEGNDPTTSP